MHYVHYCYSPQIELCQEEESVGLIQGGDDRALPVWGIKGRVVEHPSSPDLNV